MIPEARPDEAAEPIRPSGPASAGQRRLRLDAVDDDQLLAAGRAGHDPDVASGDPELIGEEADQRDIRGALDGRGADPDRSTPSTTPSTRSAADRGVRRTAKRTAEEVKTSEGAPQEAVGRHEGRVAGSATRRSLPVVHRQPPAQWARGGGRPGPPARRDGAWGRSPNSARPTRTIVAPSSMATSKSSVMPIDSVRTERRASAPGSRSDSSRKPPNVGRASAGSAVSRPIGHEAVDVEARRARRSRRGPRGRSSGAKPALAGSWSTLTWRRIG